MTDAVEEPLLEVRATRDPALSVIEDARAQGAAMLDKLVEVGAFGTGVLVPDGWQLQLVDDRDFEDVPRWREGVFRFTRPVSFTDYVARYQTAQSMLYASDPALAGSSLLTAPMTVARAVLDDHAPTVDPSAVFEAGRRRHTAEFVVAPTEAARRWGGVFDKPLSQSDLLDLVVDGIGEIAEPDGASLRDLVADLHASSSTEVRSVVRGSGDARIELSENVQLRSGPGRQVSFPERIRLVFRPWTAADVMVDLEVRVKAKVVGSAVVFTLSAPTLESVLTERLASILEHVGDVLCLPLLWSA